MNHLESYLNELEENGRKLDKRYDELINLQKIDNMLTRLLYFFIGMTVGGIIFGAIYAN